ncbi:MAG: hypothetical protein SV966_15270 [Actinomycetota bacterium]|nr:hypothetical protein [Actinomycetota bacterium]
MPTKARLSIIALIAAIAVATVSCGGSTTAEDSESASPAMTSAQAGAVGEKVSANTASAEEIAAGLESAGVPNAERWAEEVVEYRPYPPDDPNLQKLRDNLAKYNPGQDTVDKIVSALTP